MKKFAAIGLALVVTLLSFAACQKAGPPTAGSAQAMDMLTLLPKDVAGVMLIDINRAMNTAVADKALKESPEYQKYQEFVKETGIDPQKDVFFLALGLTGDLSGGNVSGVGIINLKYNKDTLLAKMKEKEPSLKEDLYEGVTMFTIPEPKAVEPIVTNDGTDKVEAKEAEEKTEAEEAPEVEEVEKPAGPPIVVAFLDGSNVAAGTEAGVKAVVDVLKKKTESLKTNAELMGMIKNANSAAIAWGVLAFKPEDIKKMIESTPMLSSLAALKAMAISFDYKDKTLDFDLKALTSDAGKNKEIADMLNGFKAMGALAAGEKPEIGELLGKVEITAAADNVRIHAVLPEALIDKLSKMAQAELANKLGGEVKPEEKKIEEIKK